MAVQGGPNVDLFDAYFRRADLDQDGRISGAEAVAFFQGSNLSKQVLAQIWMHADPRSTGFLGRAEFYNALKLVTVAQSKRELTPDIVKAALFGPASAKIPAPQINFASIPAPKANSMPPPAGQMGSVPPPGSQVNFRAQVPPNANMNQQYFPSQGNQSTRPQVPMPSGAPHRPQGVAGQDYPRGGIFNPSQGNQSTRPQVPMPSGAPHRPQGVVGQDYHSGGMFNPGLSNSHSSNNWVGATTGGAPPIIPTSQVPNRGVSPSTPLTASNPQVPLSIPSSTEHKTLNASVSTGNGVSSDPVFGGDLFSVNPSSQKQTSSTPTYSANSSPAISVIAPVTTGPQSTVKSDTLGSLQGDFTRQSTGAQHWQSQSLSKPSQQVAPQISASSGLSANSVEVGNSTSGQSGQSQVPWPKMTRGGVQKYTKVFVEVDTDRDGKISGEQARNLFLSWRLPREVLKQVWDLSDQDNDSMLSLREFCIALYLMERYREGRPLPPALPSSILLDETLLALAGPPNASYGGAAWGPTPGLRPQQGLPGSQSMTPSGLRPPMQGPYRQIDGMTHYNQQQARVPVMDKSQENQLSNGEHTLHQQYQEASETEKKVESKEKVILDSREKMEFYRSKMQDLVLYKSRCDNRLNEITERALADKREAELVGKKYEEKYKQVAEIASKLTIEEASFRDVQERKVELSQAIIKMEQGGSADGILQVRADRIQSDLEELLRALTERCKKHGLQVKSAALIELPVGWQPGIPEVSAVWDEDWDKFEDEGFSFDVGVATTTDSTSLQKENPSPLDSYSPDSLSNTDGKSDKLFGKVEHEPYTHSEDESTKSPQGSPPMNSVFESPTKEYSDNHFQKDFEEETDTQRSFDEPTWGTFDNNDDTDSVWGFSNAKDSGFEKQREKDFFGSGDFGLSPTRSDSFQVDSIFEKKTNTTFQFEDSFPTSPNSRVGNSSPRYSVGSGGELFDTISRFDSFSNTHEHGGGGFSSRRETLTRFDSINSSAGGFDQSHRYSFDESDPFGSSGPFKVSSDKSPRKGSESSWSAF